jgi:hypothetical protein
MIHSTSRLWLVLAMTLALVSCRKPVRALVGQPFDLHVRQAARVSKTDLDLYFRRVSSDSRCPNNAKCITAGEAVITLEGRIMKEPPEPIELRLMGGMEPDTTSWKAYDGYRIMLSRLEPYPVAGTGVDTTAYVATLIVQKR